MNCFIFSGSRNPRVCGGSAFSDLVLHLRSCGVERILTDGSSPEADTGELDIQEALPLLGNDWIAAWNGMITRQDPRTLRARGLKAGAGCAVSLACSGRPWRYATVVTDHLGRIQGTDHGPSPETARTNLCFSGLAWVGDGKLDRQEPWNSADGFGFPIPGYWRTIDDREGLLSCHYEVLTGQVRPWPHLALPVDGRVLQSKAAPDTVLRGVIWIGRECRIGKDCELENCVILDGAALGAGSRLRNTLVLTGASVPPGTILDDKYLTTLGE